MRDCYKDSVKKKILVSLSSFVALCLIIGAISIIKKPIIIANVEADATTQGIVMGEMAMNVDVPSCEDENGAAADCFPIISGVNASSQAADIELAWKRMYKHKSNTTTTTPKTTIPTTPITSTPKPVTPIPTTAPTKPVATTPTIPTTPIIATTPIIPKTPVATPPATPAVPAPTQPIVVTNKQWGAFLPNSSTADIATLESKVGSPMDIRAVFVGWGNGASDFPSWLTGNIKSSGKTLLMYWEPAANGDTGNINQPAYNYDSITSGKWDSSIIAFAKAAKTYGGPIILVPFDEMNGDWYPWSGTNNGNSPAKHNAAYKHLHDLFAAQGVTNVKWGWAPNNDSWPNTPANDLTMYYPGDAYVDYVGVDGFNFNSPWISYNQIFDKAIAKLEKYNKPIYIFSMASGEAGDGGAKKAAWIADTFAQIAKNPKIAGWIWFNENKEKNWLLDSSTSVLKAFSIAVKSF